MLKRVIFASVLALSMIGVAGAAQADDRGDPECATANGVGIFIGGVTNPEATCYGDDFSNVDNPNGGYHAHCDMYLVFLASCE